MGLRRGATTIVELRMSSAPSDWGTIWGVFDPSDRQQCPPSERHGQGNQLVRQARDAQPASGPFAAVGAGSAAGASSSATGASGGTIDATVYWLRPPRLDA